MNAPNAGGRIASIDILRGFAILWVIAYHLWTDLRFPNVYPEQSDAFHEVAHQLAEADVAGAIAAAGEAFLRVGYLGVPLFMLLSGYSLTLMALRRGASPSREFHLLPRRMRRLLLPYYAGLALTVAFACALAFVQWQRHGGAPFSDYLQDGDISMETDQLIAGILIVPRMFRDEWQFAPEGSLWFVLLVVQYYLLFPILLRGLVHLGPALFTLAALAVTVASSAAMIAANGDLVAHRSWIELAAPFRMIEFAAGMSMAYVAVRQREAVVLVRQPLAGVLSLAAGSVIFVAGCVAGLDDGYRSLLQWPLIVAGLALVSAPLLAKVQGRFEAARPMLSLAWVGAISYTVLIVNEPLRSITHTLRAEGAATAWVAVWVVAGLLPLTFILARPLAIALGLVKQEGERSMIPDLVDSAVVEQAMHAP